MEVVIVTRHPALREYLQEVGIISGGERVISHATSDDVAGKHVIGVLPNFLASQAGLLTEIPLAIPPEKRGKELTLEEIRQYASPPATYKIYQVDTPSSDSEDLQKWSWNDKMGHRGRLPRCWVVSPNGEVHEFNGQDIPGLVKVMGHDYSKMGKWSNSTYRCVSPAGTVNVSWMQDWETGQSFPQDSWEEAFDWLQSQAPNAQRQSFERLVREKEAKAARRFDENALAVKEFRNSK